MFPILETERLILREIKKEDSENIFACYSNNDVTRYYGQESFQNIGQAGQLVEFFSKNYHEKRGIRWGIERKDTKGGIGTVGFNAMYQNGIAHDTNVYSLLYLTIMSIESYLVRSYMKDSTLLT